MTQSRPRSRFITRIIPIAVLAVALILSRGVGAGQEQARGSYVHLNPMIAKLAEGKAVIGVSTSDFSLDAAQMISRSGADFVRLDMEHAPFDAETIRMFLLGMQDRAGILKRGNNGPFSIATLVRIPAYGRESPDWVAKQALDEGMMGIKFPTIDTKEQALRAVRSMRYPPPRGSKYPEPAGLRGIGAGNAVWLWGLETPEYQRHADVWPLNPDGDLFALIMIESAEGLKNIDAIASVPGVGGLFVGNVGDLPASLGVTPDAPEVEAGLQTALKACKAHNVVCGCIVDEKSIEKRIKEGWRYLDIGRATGGLAAGPSNALKAGRALIK